MGNPGVVVISLVVLVGVVAAVAVTINKGTAKAEETKVSTSAKASMCQSAEYKTTCDETVEKSNSSDPKEIVKTSFLSTIDEIRNAISNSTTIKELTNDNMTKQAVDICSQVLHESIESLNNSFHRVDKLNPQVIDEYMVDLKTWVSSVISDQTTCMDGFRHADTATAANMKKFLHRSRQLTVTGLDMLNQLEGALKSLVLNVSSLVTRRLLTEDGGGAPAWVDAGKRRVMAVSIDNLKPNVVVAKDGSGKYRSVNEALGEIPKDNANAFVIYVKEGVYAEKVDFTKHMTNVVLYGDGPTKSRITGRLNYAEGVQTFKTSTVSIMAADFLCKDIGFENTAGAEGHQAVNLRVQADKAVFYNCHMDGYQDTLYAQKSRQFYRQCQVTGTVDFIFGDAAAAFQNCDMIIRKPGPGQNCMVTAQGRDARQENTGTVLQNCRITAEPALVPAAGKEFRLYLGRPWKAFARTVYIQTEIDGVVDPSGWAPWPGTTNMDTCYYAEYGNRGAGANTDKRVDWEGYERITAQEAETFTANKFMLGDTWVLPTGVPFFGGWMDL